MAPGDDPDLSTGMRWHPPVSGNSILDTNIIKEIWKGFFLRGPQQFYARWHVCPMGSWPVGNIPIHLYQETAYLTTTSNWISKEKNIAGPSAIFDPMTCMPDEKKARWEHTMQESKGALFCLLRGGGLFLFSGWKKHWASEWSICSWNKHCSCFSSRSENHQKNIEIGLFWQLEQCSGVCTCVRNILIYLIIFKSL